MRIASWIVGLIGTLFLLVAGDRASAQTPIRVSVGGVTVNGQNYTGGCGTSDEYVISTHAASAAISIDIGSLYTQFNGFTNWYIRIDDTTNTNQAIGVVTLTNVATSLSSDVRIIIGNCDQVGFPNSPDDPFVGVGGGSLAGVTLASGFVNPEQIRLAAYLNGSISGNVTVGQIYSLQARGSGSITGNVAALKADNRFDPNDDAILFLSAQNAITGNIEATNGSIGQITVGAGNANSGGIDGDIKAENGTITSLRSTGPIGAARLVSIRAGDSIDQMYVGVLGNDGLPNPAIPRSVNAAIVSNLLAPGSATDFEFGHIREMRVSGDLTGTIDAYNVTNTYEMDPFGSTYGIFITGDALAPISVELGVTSATIQARSFTHPITIGTYLIGKIVATNGRIERVSIGREPEPSALFQGFVGGVTGASWDPFRFEGNEPECVIRASSIGVATISKMENRKFLYAPRIESPTIDELIVDEVVHGVVWSGVRSATDCPGPTTPVESYPCGPNAAKNETYANIGQSTIAGRRAMDLREHTRRSTIRRFMSTTLPDSMSPTFWVASS